MYQNLRSTIFQKLTEAISLPTLPKYFLMTLMTVFYFIVKAQTYKAS